MLKVGGERGVRGVGVVFEQVIIHLDLSEQGPARSFSGPQIPTPIPAIGRGIGPLGRACRPVRPRRVPTCPTASAARPARSYHRTQPLTLLHSARHPGAAHPIPLTPLTSIKRQKKPPSTTSLQEPFDANPPFPTLRAATDKGTASPLWQRLASLGTRGGLVWTRAQVVPAVPGMPGTPCSSAGAHVGAAGRSELGSAGGVWGPVWGASEESKKRRGGRPGPTHTPWLEEHAKRLPVG